MLTSSLRGKFLVEINGLQNLSQKRYNIRQQLSRYHEPEKFKKHMLHACEPYLKPKYLLPNESCNKTSRSELELHPLDIIYGDELIETLKQKNSVLFLQHNYCGFQSLRVFRNNIIKLGGNFHSLNNRIYRYVFEKLNRPEILHLLITRNTLITCDISNLIGCIQTTNRMSEFVLLAGLIDGNMLSYDSLMSIVKNKNLDAARMNLSITLNMPGQHLTNILMNSNKD